MRGECGRNACAPALRRSNVWLMCADRVDVDLDVVVARVRSERVLRPSHVCVACVRGRDCVSGCAEISIHALGSRVWVFTIGYLNLFYMQF